MKKSPLVVTGLGLVLLTTLHVTGHDELDFQGTFPAPATSGGGAVEFSSNGVSLIGWLTVADLDPGSSGANDCWGYTSPSGREYAIIGMTSSTSFVEISDPGQPTLVANLAGPSSLWHDIKTYQSYAYSVSEGGGGIQVFDMTNIDAGVVTLANTITGNCGTTSHNVVIDEVSGYLYRTGMGNCGGGLAMYSLADPTTPTYVGNWTQKYVHDAQVFTWDQPGPYLGRQIAFCCVAGTGLDIVDVTNKNSPTVIGRTTYPNTAYSHQGWISADRRYFYLNDESDEGSFGIPTTTHIIDISDLANPVETGIFTSGSPSIDHNLYVKDDLVFEANYRSGLRVFDATNPTSPFEIAYFDTYEADDAAAFNSLWSCFPYFDSGTIIGSDLEKGLFVWRLGDPELAFDYPGGQPEFVSTDGSTTLQIRVIEETPGDLAPGTVEFFVDSGSGFQSAAVAPTADPLRYVGTFPPGTCGEVANWYVRALSDDSVTWSDPLAGSTQVGLATYGAFATTAFSDDVEANTGWTGGVAGDTATTGVWVRTDPIGTGAQPEDDHTANPGIRCWFTGQGSAGGSIGENDIDNGFTTLLSPILDASGLAEPTIRYWRWYANNGNGTVDDIFEVDISDDGGSSWENVEILGPVGPGTSGGWIQSTVRIADHVTPTNQIQLRFRASDLGGGSIVEAAIDDLEIVEFVCAFTIASVSPGSGAPAGGNTVTISGEGFLAGQTSVAFGGTPSPQVTVLNGTTLRAVVPAGAALPGPRGKSRFAGRTVDVTVSRSPGESTLVGGYTYGEELRTP